MGLLKVSFIVTPNKEHILLLYIGIKGLGINELTL